MVTHGISFLSKVDKIMVLKDGQVSEVGSFTELMNHNGAFAEFLKNYLTEEIELKVEGSDDAAELEGVGGIFLYSSCCDLCLLITCLVVTSLSAYSTIA